MSDTTIVLVPVGHTRGDVVAIQMRIGGIWLHALAHRGDSVINGSPTCNLGMLSVEALSDDLRIRIETAAGLYFREWDARRPEARP